MNTASSPQIWCRRCGYALAGVASGRCPECSRRFDPAMPGTWDRSRWSRFRRRCVWAAIALTLGVLVLAAFAPCGYAIGRARLATLDGMIDREAVRIELMPSLLGVRLGGWERVVAHAGPPPGSGDATFSRRPHTAIASANAYLWGLPPFRPLLRSFGSMSGSTAGDEQTVGFFNRTEATLSNLPAIARGLSGQMVRSGAYGVTAGAHAIGEPIPDFEAEQAAEPVAVPEVESESAPVPVPDKP